MSRHKLAYELPLTIVVCLIIASCASHIKRAGERNVIGIDKAASQALRLARSDKYINWYVFSTDTDSIYIPEKYVNTTIGIGASTSDSNYSAFYYPEPDKSYFSIIAVTKHQFNNPDDSIAFEFYDKKIVPYIWNINVEKHSGQEIDMSGHSQGVWWRYGVIKDLKYQLRYITNNPNERSTLDSVFDLTINTSSRQHDK